MEKLSAMLKRLVALRLVLAVLIFAGLAHSQTVAPKSGAPPQSGTPKDQKAAPAAPAPVDYDGWGRPILPQAKNPNPAPAPQHDISGSWDPANGPEHRGPSPGAKTLPVHGTPGHEPPYTPLGPQASSQPQPSN